ncbi:MAG: hypothetical protein GY832_09260, partial [Chloroflexi bacterium]|nr:hypothetical protein [Chloroflexota bacterium]
MTKYYYVGGKRVAMRAGDVVYYLHNDYLGSTSLTTNENGGVTARQLYYPYGEVRWGEGTLATDFGFTGQRRDSYIDMIQMGARWYNPQLGRWASADTIVPDLANPQSLNRYGLSQRVESRREQSCGVVSYPDPDIGKRGIEAWVVRVCRRLLGLNCAA